MIQLTDKEFDVLVEYMKKNYGINLINKRNLINSRMGNYLELLEYDSFQQYIDDVASDKTGETASNLINKLTTNYTYFLREEQHFAFLKTKVLPELIPGIRDHDLRIWSAGCSSGEEPYTIAMLLNEYFEREMTTWDKKLLATDICKEVLIAAKTGVYGPEEIEAVPKTWRSKYFKRTKDDKYEVSESIKNEVIFRVFNLMSNTFPFKKKFHVIFCRNVMIYFDKETKENLVNKFYDALEYGGYLMIGHSESIDKSRTNFKYVSPSVYRKV